MQVAVIDTGLGNLHSARKALEAASPEITAYVADSPAELERATHAVLPGVGNFSTCMERLRSTGLDESLVKFAESGRPLLGICLGMQLLAELGDETSPGSGPCPGLGLIPGRVRKLRAPGLRLPHLGWQEVKSVASVSGAMFSGIAASRDFFFVHGYYLDCPPHLVAAWCDYGDSFPAAVVTGNIWAVQFHPEKSREAGIRLLSNFLEGDSCSKFAWFLPSS